MCGLGLMGKIGIVISTWQGQSECVYSFGRRPGHLLSAPRNVAVNSEQCGSEGMAFPTSTSQRTFLIRKAVFLGLLSDSVG